MRTIIISYTRIMRVRYIQQMRVRVFASILILFSGGRSSRSRRKSNYDFLENVSRRLNCEILMMKFFFQFFCAAKFGQSSPPRCRSTVFAFRFEYRCFLRESGGKCKIFNYNLIESLIELCRTNFPYIPMEMGKNFFQRAIL